MAGSATARRAAQRRTARALREGRATLPGRLTSPVRKAQGRATLHNPEVNERKIAAKEVDEFPGAKFGELWQYSPDTVKYFWSHMSDGQREQALAISAAEYRQMAAEQNGFNVFWYHHMDEYPEAP
jgi:hypothetical protein